MVFPTTHWTLLAKATLHGDSQARAALNDLCKRYWLPLQRFIVARGYTNAEAEDLTQEFLLHLMNRSALRKPDPLRGRFRSFLLGSLSNYLSHERDRRLTQKRGGQNVHLNVDTLNDSDASGLSASQDVAVLAFDRAWALSILQAALLRVKRSYIEAGKEDQFTVLRQFLPGQFAAPSYEQAAHAAGTSVGALNSEVHRLRRQLQAAVHAEIARTVSAPHEIEDELSHLLQVLIDRNTEILES